MKSYLTHLECTYCNAIYSAEEPHRLCAECGKVLYPRYDLGAAKLALYSDLWEGAFGRGLEHRFTAPDEGVIGVSASSIVDDRWPAVRKCRVQRSSSDTVGHSHLYPLHLRS